MTGDGHPPACGGGLCRQNFHLHALWPSVEFRRLASASAEKACRAIDGVASHVLAVVGPCARGRVHKHAYVGVGVGGGEVGGGEVGGGLVGGGRVVGVGEGESEGGLEPGWLDAGEGVNTASPGCGGKIERPGWTAGGLRGADGPCVVNR
jgi:hypothetical protein